MTNLESLRSLQKRIREATGPDRELDDDIFASLFPEKSCRLVGMHEDAPDIRMFEFSHATGTSLRVTGSLDACVALMREVLPGWSLCLTVGLSGDYAVIHEFAPPCRRLPSEPFSFRSYNICLTALDAILSALIAQEEANEKAG